LLVNEELCKLTGMKSRLTTAYHPQTNGLDERFNQTMQRQLLKYIGDQQDDWDLYLDTVLFSYWVSKQASTKCSPFYLMYGRRARLPVEFKKQNENNCDSGEDSETGEALNYVYNSSRLPNILFSGGWDRFRGKN